jgi:hypothetical protein
LPRHLTTAARETQLNFDKLISRVTLFADKLDWKLRNNRQVLHFFLLLLRDKGFGEIAKNFHFDRLNCALKWIESCRKTD